MHTSQSRLVREAVMREPDGLTMRPRPLRGGRALIGR
jgi:hypothetical protein